MTTLSSHRRLIAELTAVAFVVVGVLQTDGTPGRVAIAAWVSAICLGVVARQERSDVLVRATLIGMGLAWCLVGLVALLASGPGGAGSVVVGCLALLAATAVSTRQQGGEGGVVPASTEWDDWGGTQTTSWSAGRANDGEDDW